MRSHPAKYGEGFDAPPTLERSGSERRGGAVSSLFPEGGRPLMVEAGEPEIIKAEAVFLAMGFLKPQQPEFAENVFVAGDAASGASLVVRAMASGRKIAAQVDKFLNK